LQSRDVPTRDQAFALIDQNEWESYSQTTEVPDEKRCLQRILQQQIRVEADKVVTRTIGELVDIATHHAADADITATIAQAVLGRNGIKADDGYVFISNTAEAIATMLRDTAWANCWSTVLARLPGAAKAGTVYFRGTGLSGRAVKIPIQSA